MSLFLINEIVAFIFGLFFNIILLFLIHFHTPDFMRSYAIILRIHAISDILFDFTNFITSTVSYLTKNLLRFFQHSFVLQGRYYFINYGILRSFWTPKTVFYAVQAYFWIVIYVPMWLMPLDFYYRLRAVC